MDERTAWMIIGILLTVSIIGGFVGYEYYSVKIPLKDFCNNINNSELVEYKDQWCSSRGSDYLVKCSNGNIYGVDTTRHCERWDTWGDCIKLGETKFKLSHLTYPKC